MRNPERLEDLTRTWTAQEIGSQPDYEFRRKWYGMYERAYMQARNPDQVFTDREAIPEAVGCYAFFDRAIKRIVRVGRSFNLKSRVNSYFKKSQDASMKRLRESGSLSRCDIFIWYERSLHQLEKTLAKKFDPVFNRFNPAAPRSHYVSSH